MVFVEFEMDFELDLEASLNMSMSLEIEEFRRKMFERENTWS